MFYYLDPDVPGLLGEPTVLDTTVHPPRVVGPLYYEIDNWFGDDLISAHPCYLVTEKLANLLTGSGLGRFEIRDVEMIYGEEAYDRLHRHGFSEFPKFRWLFVTGTAGEDDVGLTPRGRLIVSDAALEVFRQGDLNGCDIEEYDPDTHK
ncbi:hypothetical protein [Saccharopolyspora rosea]|uniref:Uncharacterized protein n=1 Tax=Saccharopolyspora rosea TaxID=524884 RepID=A0ABW3FK72_9PSEU|nr:hypothetical protein [Saccharopolyspora rosea]